VCSEDVKVNIVKHPHSLISPIEEIDGIRMYGNPDIAAMKINAILLGRGRKKDFWYLYTLLQHYSLQEIIDFNEQKFKDQYFLISIPTAITYFADAEESETPVSLKGQTWEKIKSGILKKVREYLK